MIHAENQNSIGNGLYICILGIAIFVHRKVYINLYLCGKFKGKKKNAWVSLILESP